MNFLNRTKCFIIAELSANHGHDIEIAKETIRAAKRAGADAIKLQTYTADTITLDAKTDDFKISGTIWEGQYLYDLYKEASLPWEWHKALFDVAKEEGLVCFSSPFDKTAVDFLEELNCPIYKIASFEITDIPLIEYVASKGKPVIISTGIADEEDIRTSICGTYEYMPPEVVFERKHGFRVDIWCLGILLYEFLYGELIRQSAIQRRKSQPDYKRVAK